MAKEPFGAELVCFGGEEGTLENVEGSVNTQKALNYP